MKKLLEYLPFYFLICVIIGIFLQFYTNIWEYNFTYLIAFLFLFLICLYIFKRSKYRKLFSIITLFFFVLIGVSTTFIHNPKNYTNYYEHHISNNSGITLNINKVLKPGNYYHKFIADVIVCVSFL